MLIVNILKGFAQKWNVASGLLFCPIFPQVFAVGNHTLLLFVPEFVEHATQTLDEGNLVRDLVKNWIFVMATSELIVRHQRVEVVNMVVTNVSRQPVKYLWKVIKSASLNSRADVIPLVFPFLV